MCACSQTHMGPCMCRNQKATSDVILRPSLLWSPPLWLAGPASEPAGPPGLLPPPPTGFTSLPHNCKNWGDVTQIPVLTR